MTQVYLLKITCRYWYQY